MKPDTQMLDYFRVGDVVFSEESVGPSHPYHKGSGFTEIIVVAINVDPSSDDYMKNLVIKHFTGPMAKLKSKRLLSVLKEDIND